MDSRLSCRVVGRLSCRAVGRLSCRMVGLVLCWRIVASLAFRGRGFVVRLVEGLRSECCWVLVGWGLEVAALRGCSAVRSCFGRILWIVDWSLWRSFWSSSVSLVEWRVGEFWSCCMILSVFMRRRDSIPERRWMLSDMFLSCLARTHCRRVCPGWLQ